MGFHGAALLVFLSACTGKDQRVPPPAATDTGTYETDWLPPSCTSISGTDAVTFTSDDGATAAPTAEPLVGPAFSTSLVALDTAGSLAAVVEGKLLRSTDAGCTWSTDAFPTDEGWRLTPAPGGRLYAWNTVNADLVAVDGDSFTALAGPADRLTGLVADPADAQHLRAGTGDCAIYESFDGGQSWAVLSQAPTTTLNAYTVAFDPSDLDHVACTLTNDGLFVSDNAGLRWDAGRGIAEGENVNVFTATFAAAGTRVWAEGLRLDAGEKAIWMSEDSGTSFVPVIQEDEGIALDTEVPLSTHPSAPDTVFFASGDFLFRYDASTGVLTANAPVGLEIDAVLVSPAPLGTVYLGLSATDNNL